MICSFESFGKMCKTAFFILIKNRRNVIPNYEHIIIPHASSTSEIKQMKHLPELNILTVWYVTSVSGFTGWYVALFWEDYEYFCWSSLNNLMKGENFLWSVSKMIEMKSLLKSELIGKDAFDISSWSGPSFILIFSFLIW